MEKVGLAVERMFAVADVDYTEVFCCEEDEPFFGRADIGCLPSRIVQNFYIYINADEKWFFQTVTTCMKSFLHWLKEHDDRNLVMPCDQVLPTIAAAGPNGISVEELRSRFKEMKTLLEWLRMLERHGAIVQFVVGEKRFVRAA